MTTDELEQLVIDGRRGRWPTASQEDQWRALANLALQLDTGLADAQEALAWLDVMRDLVAARLPYEQFITARQGALDERIRRRKLDQANIRYRYGFRSSAPRRASLVRLDIKRALTPD